MSHKLYRPLSHQGAGPSQNTPQHHRVEAPMSKEAADKIASLIHESHQKDKLIDNFRQSMKAHEQRLAAEELLRVARSVDNAPAHLRAHTVDSYLSKRAELELRPVDELTKHIEALQLLAGERGPSLLTLSDIPQDGEDLDPYAVLEAEKDKYRR